MPANSARILVVDDNPATLYSTSHVLRSVGWDVEEAATGSDAVAKSTKSIDLVVLDVNLPDFDGFEVCRRIRAAEKTARVPIIHLSATFVGDVHKVHGYEVGADGYLTHPIEPPVLIATVRAFLRTREAEARIERLLASERAARTDAEEANRVKDEFLAVLSHELRTPLNAIVGWAQVLKLTPFNLEDYTEGVDAIERNAKAQAQMIGDLLDISRITSGKLRLDVRPVHLVETVEAALNAIVPAADAKGIRITKVLDSAAAPIKGDASRLQQVIWNLVSNAVKFTPKGGKIQVTLERVNSHVELSVADTGQGISAQLLPVIFERFKQGDATSTRETGGLGLGLALAKQFVELHGGTIRAESAGPDKGSRFVITLPVAISQETANAAALAQGGARRASAPTVRLDGIHVLLVDDESDARESLKRLLEGAGATVAEAPGMEGALDYLESQTPDILVSDIGMPQHDGFELIQAVRQRGFQYNQLPAIALTAFARPEDRRRILLSGFQMHVAKPIEIAEIAAVISTLLGRTGLAN